MNTRNLSIDLGILLVLVCCLIGVPIVAAVSGFATYQFIPQQAEEVIRTVIVEVTSKVPAATEAPIETPLPTESPAAPPATLTCRVIHDYQLQDLPEVATTNGNFLHVEYWTDGNSERETILPGNRYLLNTALKGHVWEYSDCTFGQVMEQVNAHIIRRLNKEANNDGYVPWEDVGFFDPVQ